MASNFLNPAGTDLDSLFYVNNSNAGALGFKVSDGQDLGNRYASGSLGYNVGFKNNAGTDIGFLRGNLAAPSGSATFTLTNEYIHSVGEACVKEDSSGDSIEYYRSWSTIHRYTMTPHITISNGQSVTSVTYTLQAKDDKQGEFYYTYNENSTTMPAHSINTTTCYSDSNLKFKMATSYKDVLSYTTSSLNSPISIFWRWRITGKGRNNFYTRMKIVISNSAGSTTLYTGETHAWLN